MCRLVEVYIGEVDTSKCKNKIKREGDKWLKGLTQKQREAVLAVQGAKDWQRGTDWRKNMRGWYGLSNPRTRLMGNLFEVENTYAIASGALNNTNDPNYERRYNHACLFYETLRNNGVDAF